MNQWERGRAEEKSPVDFARPLPIAILLAIWTLPALTVAIMMVIQNQTDVSPPFWPLFMTQCAVWLPWALITPLAFRLGARYPLSRDKWLGSIFVHLGAALFFAALFNLYLIVSELAIFGQRPFAFSEIWALFTDRPQAVLSTVPVYLFIWAVGRGIAYYQRGRARDALLAQARLRLLESRLQPHFLFNTLHAIATLMEEDVDGARRMLVQLSALLRANLTAGNDTEVTLADELELLKKYLEIEQIRFADRLCVAYRIDPEIESAMVPQFLLQPLVENAIRHGISRISDAGALIIEAYRSNGHIVIKIEDDGPGLAEIDDNQGGTSGEGLGLSITRERLAVRHGTTAHLTIEDREPRGCCVCITLPFLTLESP